MWTSLPQLRVQASTWPSVVGNGRRGGDLSEVAVWGAALPRPPGRWQGALQAVVSVPTGGHLNLSSLLPPEGEALSHRPGAS